MANLCDMYFQFRGNPFPLSKYIRLDARNTALAEGRGVGCSRMEDRDGAVTAVLRGRVGVAVLERLEFLMVAAGGGNVQVAPTHFACRGCGCDCITGYISSPLGIQGIEKGGGIPVTLNRNVRVPSSSLSTFSLDERQRRLLCDLGPIVFFVSFVWDTKRRLAKEEQLSLLL